MQRLFAHRAGHYLLLLGVSVLVLVPNLGATSLWDDDEGVNAECAREMREAGTWIVPTFNWDLRTAKPVFLYWLMRASYAAFGESEWAARLPSVLMTMGLVLVVYELGRRMFDSATAVLAGVITATSLELCKLGHAATPDATLLFFNTLYFLCFWVGTVNGGRGWFLPCSAASALAFLTKGPVGLVLPAAVVGLWFAWNRELYRLVDRRMIWGSLLWALIAVPWYAMVAAETRGEWIRTFFLRENLGRSAEPMENHRGPVFYYLVVLCLFFAPWSSFLYATIRHSLRGFAERFLLLWCAVYLLTFSLVATKLPHYIAPIYPALALLTARFLVRWMRGEWAVPKWIVPAGIVGVAATGLTVGLGMLIAGGVIPLPISPEKMRLFPGLEAWAWIGAIPVAGAVAMAVFLLRGQRGAVVLSLAVSNVLFVGLTAAFPLLVIDRYKAARDLVQLSGARQLDRDVKVASVEYSQPSLTYYVGRKVDRLRVPESFPVDEHESRLIGMVAEYLDRPEAVYVFIPERTWQVMEPRVRPGVGQPIQIIAAKYDFTRNATILALWNGR